jgi:hypothetical protein
VKDADRNPVSVCRRTTFRTRHRFADRAPLTELKAYPRLSHTERRLLIQDAFGELVEPTLQRSVLTLQEQLLVKLADLNRANRESPAKRACSTASRGLFIDVNHAAARVCSSGMSAGLTRRTR